MFEPRASQFDFVPQFPIVTISLIKSLPFILDSSFSHISALAASNNWGVSKVRTGIDFMKSTVRLSELK